MNDAALLDHALMYAAAGFPVLPIHPRGKAPNGNLARRGKDSATIDPTVIGEWWRRCPTGNIGIRPVENVVVLDVDPRAGGDLEQLGDLPPTWTARTGGGGWHLWFRHRFTRHPRGQLGGKRGVDIKTSAGYLIAPSSIHRDTGRRYEWVNDAPIAPLPEHLRSKVEYPEPVRPQWVATPAGRMDGLVRAVAEAVPGKRNQVLFWAACRAIEQGADQAVLDLLRAAALTCGLDEVEVERTLRSAERRCA
ncbi:bifunctional DNA primase/polymerase [Nocardia anaemiae]|uniref:bifunctional DNA primase/polymerase n=1 Tax=Nocardia anaemiae TaxID=263910 RepID=UPI0007A4C4D8|nr:bifunctional DNA primase/polymerase [Nocardia anaemiae]